MATGPPEPVDIQVRFYGELNDFLPASCRGVPLDSRVQRRTSIKDAIERWGVPHGEVALVLVGSEPARFDYLVERPTRISVYPAFRRIPLDGLPHLQPGESGEHRFVADAHLAEVLARFGLAAFSRPFTRCTRCNGLLRDVAKAAVLDRLEPLTREHYDQFRQCAVCGQVYWRGSHYDPLAAIVREALAGAPSPSSARQPGGKD
ncbi:MAG: hypothetical protein AMXMBFR80_08370 [Dehalococcoidia bacterium]